MKRSIAMVMAVVFATAGCKSKEKKDEGGGSATGSGTGTASGSGTGTGSASGSGSGTSIATTTGTATITLSGGGDASAYTATIKAPADAPPEVQEMLARVDGVYDTLKTVELGPDGTKLATPAIVTVTIDNLPAGRSMDELQVALISSDGTVEDVKIVGVNGNDVQVEVAHFSLITVMVATGLIVMTAGLAFGLRGGSDPIMKKDCARFIDPSDPKVEALAADPSKFAVDTSTGAVTLDLPLKGKDVDQGAHLLTVSQVIDKGEGDCVNMSTLFGSLLAAKKYPVRQVSGTATYARNGKTYKGGHQWVEVVIDRKTYYVDTFEPSQTRLIPIDQASSELNLKRGRMCGRGIGSMKYDPQWYAPFETDPTAVMKEELEALKAEHRKLHADCQKNVAGACADREAKYDEAKKLQEEINALEAANP